MSLKVRKLAIQVADITDFGVASGVSALVAGSGITLSPASGVGTVTVTNSGVVQLLAGTAISLSPAGGTGTVTVTAVASVGGPFILRSPSGENQVILPLTDNVPLTIKGFSGGTSNLLVVQNSAGTAMLTVGAAAGTVGAVNITPSGGSAVPLTLKPAAGGAGDAFDVYDASSPQVLVWKVLFDGTLKGTINTANQAIQVIAPGGTVMIEGFQTGDSQPRIRLIPTGNSGIVFGPGGAASLDARLIRTGASALQFDANAGSNLAVTILGPLTVNPASGNIPLTLTGASGSTANLLTATTTGQTGSVTVDYRNRVSTGTITVSSSIFGLQAQKQLIVSPHNVAPAVSADRIATLLYLDWNGYAADVNGTYTFFSAAGNLNLGTLLSSTVIGLNFSPQLAGANTVTLFDSLQIGGFNATIGATTTTRNFIHITAASADGGPTTTKRGIFLESLGGASPLTTVVGIDIAALPTATTAIAVRQSGTVEVNLWSGMSRFGDQTSPVANVDATGAAGTTMKAQGKNVLVVENRNETQSSITVPNADTNIKTYVLPANSYTSVIAEAEGYLQEGALSTDQDVNIKVTFGGVQQGVTMIVRPGSVPATSAKTPFKAKASGAFAGGGTIAITGGAAAADANSTIFVNSLRVFGEV